eukprot:GHVH01016642.1.p1 GENE.GHVH01016642.1~~GHVH01016642.1.p1  ORF type:complete len:343 (+),score=59.78 GHVH01016642.1:47-1030(+)
MSDLQSERSSPVYLETLSNGESPVFRYGSGRGDLPSSEQSSPDLPSSDYASSVSDSNGVPAGVYTDNVVVKQFVPDAVFSQPDIFDGLSNFAEDHEPLPGLVEYPELNRSFFHGGEKLSVTEMTKASGYNNDFDFLTERAADRDRIWKQIEAASKESERVLKQTTESFNMTQPGSYEEHLQMLKAAMQRNDAIQTADELAYNLINNVEDLELDHHVLERLQNGKKVDKSHILAMKQAEMDLWAASDRMVAVRAADEFIHLERVRDFIADLYPDIPRGDFVAIRNKIADRVFNDVSRWWKLCVWGFIFHFFQSRLPTSYQSYMQWKLT